jgi:hypothetical protein
MDPAKAISPALFLSHRAEKVSRPPGASLFATSILLGFSCQQHCLFDNIGAASRDFTNGGKTHPDPHG